MTLKDAQQIMQELDAECWVIYSAENSDPFFAKLFTSKTVVPAIGIVTPTKASLIVHELDADNVNISDVNIHRYATSNELESALSEVLNGLNWPSKIYLNYSTMSDMRLDILGAGTYKALTKRLRALYSSRRIQLASAERILYGLCDRKSEAEIQRMEIAARRAQEILAMAFRKISAGMTEKDVVDLVHRTMETRPDYFENAGVVSEECAWDSEFCPVVLAGPNLTKGGHAEASDHKILAGETVYMDFGVTLTFSDGEEWSSDVQRMGYLLQPGEKQAPQPVQDIFRTLYEAVSLGTERIRPKLRGYEIDGIVREVIIGSGYPSYNHSTGHAIGEEAHNPGALLGSRSAKRAQLTIQDGGVYTIEPRIAIENGGSIEEMVAVTHSGGRILGSRQEKLYLI